MEALSFLELKKITRLQFEGIIDNVIWNGRIGKYGLPTQAPGGVTGTPDIIFTIDDTDFVLELTTIQSKASQWSAEGASVPDHVLQHSKRKSMNVHGIFSAPVTHSRNVTVMKESLSHHKLNISCFTIDALLEVFQKSDRSLIYQKLIDGPDSN